MIRFTVSISAALLVALPLAAEPIADYAEFCAECHGPARLGALGPALIPETLGRMRGPNLEAVIREGRAATQMPAFEDELDGERIAEVWEQPFAVATGEVFCSASVGIAVGREPQAPAKMLREADAAMYRAKERGRGRA